MQFIVGKAYKMRNGDKAFYLGSKEAYFNSSTHVYPLVFISESYTISVGKDGKAVKGDYLSIYDIMGEWVEPHPLEGTPVGTLIYVWDSSPPLRSVVKFKEITEDGQVQGQYIYGGGSANFKNGCRIPVGDI